MRLAYSQSILERSRADRVMAEPDPDAAKRFAAVAKLLPAEDRRLLDMLIVRRMSHREAARALGVVPGVITRRLQRLRNHIASPTVRAIAEHLNSLSVPVQKLAVDHFFNRMSVKLICKHSQLTRRHVQAEIDFISGWARALHRSSLRDRADAVIEK